MQRKSSMDVGLTRQMSRSFSGQAPVPSSCSAARSRSTACNGLGTVAEAPVAGTGILDLLTDPGAASASFDDICEVLGDVSKLDNISNVLSSSLVQQQGLAAVAAIKAVITNNAALNWLCEKAAANLHQFTLLEGLVDKTLLDLFQQLYQVLDLDGTIFDSAGVRLAVAAGVALLVRHLIVRHQQAHPAGSDLTRQLSPAASLSDVLAETAAAAVIAQAVKGPQQPAVAASCAAAAASAASPFSMNISSNICTPENAVSAALSPFATAINGQSLASTPSSTAVLGAPSPFKAVTSSLLAEQELSPVVKARVAARSLLACMVLGQFKRCNKLKKKVLRAGADLAAGTWSPAAVLACIEGAVVLHNYGELANGVATLLHTVHC
eukprot:gene3550-3819_t